VHPKGVSDAAASFLEGRRCLRHCHVYSPWCCHLRNPTACRAAETMFPGGTPI